VERWLFDCIYSSLLIVLRCKYSLLYVVGHTTLLSIQALDLDWLDFDFAS
jgi:hypothetical protein